MIKFSLGLGVDWLNLIEEKHLPLMQDAGCRNGGFSCVLGKVRALASHT